MTKSSPSNGGLTSSFWKGLLSPLANIFNNGNNGETSPGKVWSGHDASRAFARGDLNSQQAGRSVRVAFRNQSKLPLILSWISDNGDCHHFYQLKPSPLVDDGPVTALDHVENTCFGHSFCIAYAGDDEEEIRKNKKLNPRYVIGGYRPENFGSEKEEDDDDKMVHLVTISQQPSKKMFACCKPPLQEQQQQPFLRGSKYFGNHLEEDDLCWLVQATLSLVDDKQINTCDKVYEKSTLGGWPVYVEPNWSDGDKELEALLARDLEHAAKCLPKHAREILISKCPVFINRNLKYGPEVCPINGRGLCFHGEKKWLEEHFMSTDKHQCVELYCAKEYLDDCQLWGRAGVLVHEFSHAYHHMCVEEGFDNPDIKECFDQAMKDRLYDWVRVHGQQGPMAKAYSCNNCMEYFAELSAAFLGQPDMNASEEYNKWYPFNRRHIKEHDPRAYEMLKKIWKVDE